MTDTAAHAAPTPAGSPAPTAGRRLSSKAPVRPAPRVILISTLAAAVSLTAIVATGVLLDQHMLVPPLAASAALVFGAPALPLAQPRSVIGGQLVSALTGFATLAVVGTSTWAAALAGGLALGAMMAARTPHSPAAATAVIVVVTQPPTWLFLALLALATLIITATGVIRSALERSTPRYPIYWW
ncbi:HPP family protein [Streptomyces sp. NPDC053755]|uniref:HPP family protein n=1 Tax=Streptomyces sp. NPDC053755 TaxID=3155815 RepID=UPI003440A528